MTTALVFLDCEGHGPAPCLNNEEKFEFGAVCRTGPGPDGISKFHGVGATEQTFRDFVAWLALVTPPGGRACCVSDNPAYDWQFVNYYLWRFTGSNPMGHSARRIGDFWAGFVNDWHRTQDWKNLRRTKHDHHPVHDALGNLEAWEDIAARVKETKRLMAELDATLPPHFARS